MQDKNPLVSVFVILGNNPDYNALILDSIESQTYPNIEIIKNSFDLRQAKGEYILVATCDDWYDPNAISVLMHGLVESRLDLVLFNVERHLESGDDPRQSEMALQWAFPFFPYNINGFAHIDFHFLVQMNSWLGGCLFRRDFLVRHNLMKIGHPGVFARQVIVNKPRTYVMSSYMGHHIVRAGCGCYNENDFITSRLEEFVYLNKYVRSLFWLRKWREPIEETIFNLSAYTSDGQLGKLRVRNYIPQCSIHLVDHCNLNCKSCSHFSCLARAGDFELKIKDFKRDIRRLYKVTKGNVRILELYGGEPLLHPNVLPFMKFARKVFPRAVIRFITNGILLPQQKPDFWKTAHKYKILISPTKYPIAVDWERVQEMAKKFKVKMDFFGGTGFCQKTLYHKPLDLYGTQNPAKSFTNCQHSGCINLYKGRLYHCPVAAYVKYFNRQFGANLKLTPMDSLDIHEPGLKPNDVFDFIARPIPFCRYCFTRGTTRGHPWETTKKDISEWVLIKKN